MTLGVADLFSCFLAGFLWSKSIKSSSKSSYSLFLVLLTLAGGCLGAALGYFLVIFLQLSWMYFIFPERLFDMTVGTYSMSKSSTLGAIYHRAYRTLLVIIMLTNSYSKINHKPYWSSCRREQDSHRSFSKILVYLLMTWSSKH